MGFIMDGLDAETYDRTYKDNQLVARIIGYFRPQLTVMLIVAVLVVLNSLMDTAFPILGSGSHENAGPFTVVAMEKEAQTSIMHKQRFGERKRLANKTSQTLSQRVIPALHMCRFSCFLSYRCMLLFWNHCLVGFPKIGVAMPSTIGLRNGFPQPAAGFFTSISRLAYATT